MTDQTTLPTVEECRRELDYAIMAEYDGGHDWTLIWEWRDKLEAAAKLAVLEEFTGDYCGCMPCKDVRDAIKREQEKLQR